MTMKHFRPAFVATSFLFVACPAPAGDTSEGSSESGTGDESSTTSDDSGVNPSDPTDPTTAGEDSTTTGGETMGESMTGPDSDPSTSTSTGPAPMCTVNGDCGGDAPFCEDGECVACDGAANPNAACAGLGQNLDFCVEGACHECSVVDDQCSGSTPVCDEELLECVGCTDHAQCSDSACNFETGVCNDVSYVLWVDRLAADCAAGDGTKALPFCKVSLALTKTLDTPEAAWTIRIRAGNYTEEPLAVPNAALITLSGWDGVPRLRANEDSGPTLTVGLNAKVYLDRVQFSNNDFAEGVRCEGGRVFADDVKITTNKGAGYLSQDCTSRFNRTVFYENRGGGVESYGGTTTIVNSYVTGNGTQNSGSFGGIRSDQDNKLSLIYSTVVNNLSATGPRSLHCTGDALPGEIRNSVIIAFALPSVDCAGSQFSNSVLDEGSTDDGILVATMADIGNFFAPMMAGVYKAKPGTLMKDVAQWKTGDPKRDYDGQARPVGDGDLDWPGADIPME